MNYYEQQLESVLNGKTPKYAPLIVIKANGNGSDTKHLDLNKNSAKAIVKWLTDNFIDVDLKISEDNSMITEPDVIQVAIIMNKTIDQNVIDTILKLYKDAAKADPTAHWTEIVEQLIYESEK